MDRIQYLPQRIVGWLSENKAAVGAALFAILLVLGLQLTTPVIGYLFTLVWSVGALLILGTGSFLRHNQSVGPRLRELLSGLWVSATSLFVLLMLLEAVFRVFVARPDAFSFTLAAQNWKQRYWHPINSLGYRDYEWSAADLEGRTTVMVVGASYAAGHGIRDVEDRFSNVLGELLGDEYVVINVAEPGWETPQKLAALQAHPYRPDIVILSYTVNDIAEAARQFHGQYIPRASLVPPKYISFIVEESYLANFVYYQAVRLPIQRGQETHADYLLGMYNDPEVWAAHQNQLLAVYDWCQGKNISLVVVIFPSLLRPEETAFAAERVAATFEEVGVPVLDLTQEFVGKDARQLVVNSVDAHPNEAVHRLVAGRLYDIVITLPVSDDTPGS